MVAKKRPNKNHQKNNFCLKFKWKGNVKRKRRSLYLDGLQGAAEQHVVRRDQRAHRVVMGTYSVDFLQGLDVPHLRRLGRRRGKKREQHVGMDGTHGDGAGLALGAATHDDGAVRGAAVQPVPVDKGKNITSQQRQGGKWFADVHLLRMFRGLCWRTRN